MKSIEEMAREAGGEMLGIAHSRHWGFLPSELEKLEALIRADAMEQAAAIAETCKEPHWSDRRFGDTKDYIADAIRTAKQSEESPKGPRCGPCDKPRDPNCPTCGQWSKPSPKGCGE